MQTDLTVDEANDLADEILRDGDFVGAGDPGFFQRTTSRVFEFIGDVLREIFGTLFGGAGSGAGSLVAYVLLAAVLVLLVLAIVRAIRNGRRTRDEPGEPGVRIVFDEEIDPAELRRELADRRAQGDWRGAVIAGFRLAIVEMIEGDIVPERAGATTGDFGRAVGVTRPDLSGTYGDAAAAFERAFYSDSIIVSEDHDFVIALLGRVERVEQR